MNNMSKNLGYCFEIPMHGKNISTITNLLQYFGVFKLRIGYAYIYFLLKEYFLPFFLCIIIKKKKYDK